MLQLLLLQCQRPSHNVYLKQTSTWTVVLKVRRPPSPTVLCIIWTCMHPWVTTSVPVLKTTRFPYSSRRCCHIRVFHPYLTARSPPLIILWRSPRAALVTRCRPSMATSAAMTGLWWTICYPTGLMSPHLSEVLDLLFICVPVGAEQSLAGRTQVRFLVLSVQVLIPFQPTVQTHSAPAVWLFSANTTTLISSTAETG